MTLAARTLAAAAMLAVAACQGQDSRSQPGTETGAADTAAAVDTALSQNLTVSGVMIGKRIGQDNLITEPTFQFAPRDTVFISVGTEGAPDSANLAAKWRFQSGEVIDSAGQTIQPQGRENTVFHVAKPKGLAVGTYNVTVYADGDSVDSKNFAVKK